jgi:hypothetical protein
MKVLQERIGDANVYIQTLDDDLIIVGMSGSGRATTTTSLEDDVRAAYQKVKSVVRDIAGDFGKELKNLGGQVCPSQVEMEFSLGLSAEGKIVWLVTGKGEFGLKVNITWNLAANENPDTTKQ